VLLYTINLDGNKFSLNMVLAYFLGHHVEFSGYEHFENTASEVKVRTRVTSTLIYHFMRYRGSVPVYTPSRHCFATASWVV